MASKLETNFELFLTLVKKDEVFLDNLVPICEQAIEEMRRDIALQCLDFYFSRCGHKTQYLQRAYNCKALLSVPQSIYDYDGLIEMGDNFLKALELFQANTIYQFLVFNTSVDFMFASRPFLRHTTRKYFLKPLLSISKVLDTCQEADSEWRILILQQLILCLLECGKREDVCKLLDVMLELSKTVSDDLLRECQIFVHTNNLCDLTHFNFSNEISNSAKVMRLRRVLLNSFFISKSDLTTLFRCITKPDVKFQPAFADPNLISLSLREIRVLDPSSRSIILVLIALVSLINGHLSLADECLLELQQKSTFDPEMDMFYTYLLLSLQAKKITNRVHSKRGLRKFLFFLSGLCQQVSIAISLHNIVAIEVGSSLIWHLSLYILNPHFRRHIKSTLFKISSILGEIGSQHHSLRAYYFRELALCEQQCQEFEVALNHLEQSLKYINDEHWIMKLNYEISLLKLKMHRFSFANDPLIRAVQLLSNISKVMQGIKLRETLINIAELLIGHSISPFIDTQEYNHTDLRTDDPFLILDFLERSVDMFIESSKRIQVHTLPTSMDKLRCQLLFELSKIARQMGIWDICRISSRFCLFYNDGRWGNFAKFSNVAPSSEKELINSAEYPVVTSKASIASGRSSKKNSSLKFRDQGILQIFAEAQYILAEGIVQFILKEDLQLHVSPDLTSFHLNDLYKDDQRWLKFASLMNTLSVTAVERFIFAGQWALDLNQSWLISNSLVCFWNYTRHLYTLKNEIVLLQPLRDIYSHITSKHNVSPHLLIYKLSYACINCLYQSSQHTKSVPPVIPGTTLKGSLKNDKDKKNVDTPISSSGFGTQLEVVSEELLKEAKEICEFSLSLLMNIDLNLTNFKQLVSIWVKVLIQLGQKIRYEFLIELFKDSDDLHIIKATVMIEVLSSKNSNLLVPEIALSSAFDCLTCSKSPNSIINLELIIELAGLYLNVEHYSMVSSCVEYGRNIGILLLSESQTMIVHQKICFCLSQLESISAISLSCVKPFARSSEIFEQMLKAFSYGNESNSVNLFLYCLQMILNYCRLVLNTPEFTYFLTKNATTILSYLSKYKKVEISLFRFDKGKDIRIEFFMLCLDAFSRQKMWNIGLKFVELALTQIPRESHQNLFKYLIIFKSNMKIDVHMDILRIIADFDQIDQSDLWLMAAHASTSFKFKFVYYKSALESLSGVDDFLLRIEVLFEFLSWLVLIKYPPKVLCTLFEDTLGQLIEYVFERLIDNIGDDDGIYQKDAPLAPEFIHQNKNYGKFNQSFEEWTTPEIDCFFRLSIISLILSGRSDGLLYDSNLRLLLFCVYSMLNQTVVRDTDLRMTTQELSKKSKGSTKFNTNMAVPHSLPDWSQYILNRTQLIDTNQRPKISLKYPNITMYYLNYFKEELKLSLFSHYQLIPLLLIHYISTTNENCPRSWLHLSYISMMIYSKKFIFDSSYEFWKEKLYGEYFAKEDRSILHEITKDFHNQAIVLPGPFLPDSASATCKNINLDIFYTFYQSDFIIYLALEISNVLLELGELQPTIDIVAECEVFLELSPKLFFDYKIQSLKASIHDAFNFSINGQSIITRMLQDKFLPINVLLHFYNSVGNFLEYSLANEYLENYIRLFHKNISDKSWNYYSYIKTRFEFELATRKLDFAFSHIETNRKRNIIDIEILLETLYSCFCMYYSSQNFIDCISSLKNYVFYLCKLATIIDEAIPLETYSRYVMKTVLSYKRLNQLYIDTISYLNSVSLEFDVFLDNYSPICSDFANTQISFSSFGITVFEKCTELCTKKLNFHISTSTHRIFDMLVYRNFKSLEFSEQLIQNCFRIITESIAILVSLQNNPSLEYIVQLSRAMIALYHYFGTETDQMWVCYNSDSDQYSRSTMLEIIEFKEHEISQSKALFYIASSNKHFQQLTLLCLKDGININLLTDISYIQFSAIDLIPNYTRLFH